MNSENIKKMINAKKTFLSKLYDCFYLNLPKKIKNKLYALNNTVTILLIVVIFISLNSNAYGFNIRVQASDFLLPLFFITMLNKNILLKLSKSFDIKIIIFVFISLFLMGTIFHWLIFGTNNFWGIKKIIGWCICIGYFLAGFLVHEKRQNIIQTFIATAWFMGALCLIGAALPYSHNIFIPGSITRIQGFMGNPNAYGIFFCFILLLQISLNDTLPYKKTHKRIGMLIIIINLVGTTSRTAWMSFILIYILFILNNKDTKKYIVRTIIFLTLFLCTMFMFASTPSLNTHFYTIKLFFDHIDYSFSNNFMHTLQERMYAVLTLMPTFLQHPITGIGLGGAMTIHHGQEQYTIHNTALWFLFEMGIIGFAVFMWFVYKLATAIRTSSDVLIKALAFPMLSFAIASLVNELFYQRYFWLFVGMIICDSTKRSQKETVTIV